MSTSSDAIFVDYGAVARLAAQQESLPSVALLYPILGKGAPADSVLPHSLYYLYACLTDLGFAVTLQQWRVQDGARPLPTADVVYVHPMFATLRPACEALSALRAERPATTILLGNSDQHQHEMCLGGPAAEQAAQALLGRYPAIDGVLLGRNHEYSLARLLLNRAAGQPLDNEVGQVLLRRVNGEVVARRAHRIFALEDLPYLAFPGQPPAVVRIRSSIGCRGVCSYCIESRVNASSPQDCWQGMSAERFVAELRYLVERYGCRRFNVIDSSFEDAEQRGLERFFAFCSELERAQLSISLKIHLRSETIIALAAADLDRLKRVGVDVIILGAESAVPEELALFGKIADAETSARAYQRLRDDGRFFIVLGFMMFTPLTTRAMVERKLRYLERLGRAWDLVPMTSRTLVYWGSRLHRLLAQQGLLAEQGAPFAYVPYRFRDPVVGQAVEVLDRLKRRQPEMIRVQKLLYDCGNVVARASNPANREIRAHLAGPLTRLERLAASAQQEVARRYAALLRELMTLAPGEAAKGDRCADRWLADLSQVRQTLAQELDGIREAIYAAGVDGSVLLLESWFSNVNVFGMEQAA